MFLKRLLCAAAALALSFSLAACSRTNSIQKPAMSEGAHAFEVTGMCRAELINGGETLLVRGECNLMNGTNGVVSVLNADGSTITEKNFTKESSEIAYEFDVGRDWPEMVYGFISFDTSHGDRQPAEVTDAYGKKFQNLTGEDIIWDLKGVIAVFQSDPVTISGGTAA